MKWKLFILFLLLAATAISQDCDILITNGKIIDGTGNSWYYGNVAVKDGKIIKIGRDVNLSAKKTIDAKGLIIAPGFIESAMTDELPEATKAKLLADIPIGKMGTSIDIANAAVYLASAESSYMTGQTLHVNGGMSMI